jgi:hypothetical protein
MVGTENLQAQKNLQAMADLDTRPSSAPCSCLSLWVGFLFCFYYKDTGHMGFWFPVLSSVFTRTTQGNSAGGLKSRSCAFFSSHVEELWPYQIDSGMSGGRVWKGPGGENRWWRVKKTKT